MSIPKSLYEIVRQRAQFQCEYCHYPELLSSAPLSIDHIQPRSLGGSDDLNNLALACRRCNERRYNFTTGIDPETETEVGANGEFGQNRTLSLKVFSCMTYRIL